MNRISCILVMIVIAWGVNAMAGTPLYRQASAPVEARVNDLIRRMTPNEKVGQLRCPLGWEMYTKTGSQVDMVK